MVKVVTSSLSDVDCALLLVEPIPHVGGPEKALIDRIREEFPGKTVNIVATGGSAPFIVKFCRNKILYDNTLLMKGLWAIYKRNQ